MPNAYTACHLAALMAALIEDLGDPRARLNCSSRLFAATQLAQPTSIPRQCLSAEKPIPVPFSAQCDYGPWSMRVVPDCALDYGRRLAEAVAPNLAVLEHSSQSCYYSQTHLRLR